MPRVIHFEIHCDDTDRAIKFYRELFGWKIDHFGGPSDYWLINTGPEGEPGINRGLMKRRTPPAEDGAAVNAYISSERCGANPTRSSRRWPIAANICLIKGTERPAPV